MPVPSQVWTPVPEHWVCPETHTPEHVPETQVCPVQAAGVLHAPLVLQVSTPLPEHWTVPGTHEPVHAPLVQTSVQVEEVFLAQSKATTQQPRSVRRAQVTLRRISARASETHRR